MSLMQSKSKKYFSRTCTISSVLLMIFCSIFGLSVACSSPEVDHVKQGDACLAKGDFDLAIQEYMMAGKQDPNLDVQTKLDQAYAQKIAKLLEAGEYDKSIEEGLALLSQSPSDSLKIKLANAYIDRAWYYKEKRLNPYALNDLMSANEVAPQYYRAHYELGRFYNNQWQYSLAIPELSRAILLKPDFAPAYNERAFAYFKNQKFEAALTDIDKAIELEPTEAKFYYTRSLIYRSIQKNDLAIADIELAMKLSEDNALTEQLLNDLESIRAVLSR